MTAWRAYDARLGVPGPHHVRSAALEDGGKTVYWRPRLDGTDHQLEDLIYLERFSLPARVVVTEGEKACDAVRAAGLDAVGTVCGAGATPGRHVVELFTGVHVTLWPDADPIGFDHMARLSLRLEPLVASMRLVDRPPGVPAGWDAADTTPEEIRRLVAAAHDVWLNRSEIPSRPLGPSVEVLPAWAP